MIKTDGQMTCNKKDSITKLGMTMTEWREAYCYTRNHIMTTMGRCRYCVGERHSQSRSIAGLHSGSLDSELEHGEY